MALCASLCLGGCLSTARPAGGIGVGPGPEDIVVDGARLLVACGDHRHGEYGEIWQVDPATGAAAVLPRVGEPDRFAFHPHGIDLVGDVLYVVNHDSDALHGIAVYRVTESELRFERVLRDDVLTSPNDVAAMPDGSLYVTNDYGRGAQQSGRWLSGAGASTVAHYSPANGWRVAASDLQFANGIAIAPDGQVLVAQTRGHDLLAFDRAPDGALINRRQVTVGLWGADNLSITPDGDVLVTGNTRPLSMALHRAASVWASPVSIWRVTVGPPARRTVVFEDDGLAISGATVAVELGGRLYIGQAFGSYVYVVQPR